MGLGDSLEVFGRRRSPIIVAFPHVQITFQHICCKSSQDKRCSLMKNHK